MKRMLYLLLCLFGFLLVSSQWIYSDNPELLNNNGDYTSLKEKMTSFINNQMKKHNIVGLSIAVIDNQDIAWIKGFGDSGPITIRQLLTHHSGIPADYHKSAETEEENYQQDILAEINTIHVSFPR